MRTLDSMKRGKTIENLIRNGLCICPACASNGPVQHKTELEDLAMKYMEPDAYKEIARKLAETKRERTRYINEFIKPIKDKLEKGSLEFEIYGRPKSIHSIWNKMKKKAVDFEEVYDLLCHPGYLKFPN
jgi:GTP pyrophosphokinase